jgi:hypothetical protein
VRPGGYGACVTPADRANQADSSLILVHLQRAIPGKLLVIWDGLSAHRSQFVRDYIAGLNGHILTERLPAYAPELNPVEYIWAHLKQHELPNVCAKDLWHLGDRARHHLKRMRRQTDSRFLEAVPPDFGTVKWAVPQIPCSFKENVAAVVADPYWAHKGELCSVGD